MSGKRITLRQSQLVFGFGPGAMVDLPTRSVVIGGLDLWHMRERGSWRPVHEPRATAVLETLLRATGRLADDVQLTLRTPPADDEGRSGSAEPPGIEARIFPAWFVARDAETAGDVRRRRLVRWQDLNPRGRADFIDDDGRRVAVTPIRFVAGCHKGHLQDIDWSYAVHVDQPGRCVQPLWLEERGTSGDPASTRITCGCGAALSLRDAQADGRFGKCRGRRPWLNKDEPTDCGENLRFLTRTATNAYFPQVLTVISLPAAEDELTRLVEGQMDAIDWVTTEAEMAIARRANPSLRAALEGWSDAEIVARVAQLRATGHQNLAKAPKVAEFDLLASGLAEIGTDAPDARLHARTLTRDQWDGDRPRLSPIASVVAVHRLREVACLYGFTRFEAAPTAIDGDLEELHIAVEGAALANDLDWLPAVEQLGEGIFLRFDAEAIADWLARPAVMARHEALWSGWERWRGGQAYGDKLRFPNLAYYAMHGFSHALMNEIALDCGYPATALKERLYAVLEEDGPRYGLLLYTASTGAQGTLGGLVAVLPRLGAIAERALDRLALCSGDPICAEHDPDHHQDERALSGAACHSCLLVAETSCEARNLYLDRALTAPTVLTAETALFRGQA
ncbi:MULTISPECIES: DUF1998 domain-containing protein [unclassified Sphingomonas]|uniref:DUF1998 domain-containing protein n=1 Tax=unclassified Sphingomonas TaxID=196159 RepID=UPI0006FB6D47|nr:MULTISPECIES: DUF1998 domain-containing protein [unclassified Sphingomonas]KQM59964.1 hypothetical protein ASE65_09570 [Sphingomonas sp. Leaf16]KQN11362.1 hypothetical protein ASE81_10555 [Sphingomonas sp. Leaf29]KQN18684.1 hypothetical protein ASE83_10500 [Sphingomonas sp. Leaf32]